jgi:hypothetical protein
MARAPVGQAAAEEVSALAAQQEFVQFSNLDDDE